MASSPKLVQLAAVNKSLHSLMNFIRPAINFANAHTNDFFTTDAYSHHLSEKLQQDLDSVSVSQLRNYMKSLTLKNRVNSNEVSSRDVNINFKESSLDDIIHRIGQLLSHNLNASSGDVVLSLGGREMETKIMPSHKIMEHLSMDTGTEMSTKKLHEVQIMSELAVCMQQIVNEIDNVSPKFDYLVDVGSGKGYLSSKLALFSDFKVLALDSNTEHSDGSTKRSKKIETMLSRKQANPDDINMMWKKHRKRGLQNRTASQIEVGCQVHSDGTQEDGSGLAVDSSPLSPSTDDNKGNNGTGVKCDNLKNVTLFVTQDLNLSQLLRDNFKNDFMNQESSSFGLIGLHTCGSLGVDSIKLFLNCEDAKYMLNVPCCHHFLEESFYPETEEPNSRELLNCAFDFPTFPLSRTLYEARFYLGRNARMMSAHSIHRMSEETDEQPRMTILFRSMFQLLLQKKLGKRHLTKKVGRVYKKGTNFHEYVRESLAKLEDDIQVSDEEIAQIQEFCEARSERFHKFFLLRSIFAPLIEGCVLLDRLAFLLEAENTKGAHLVEIFDPKISPRCYALVALK